MNILFDTNFLIAISPTDTELEEKYAKIIRDSKTVLWNGPVGIFEIEASAQGSYKGLWQLFGWNKALYRGYSNVHS